MASILSNFLACGYSHLLLEALKDKTSALTMINCLCYWLMCQQIGFRAATLSLLAACPTPPVPASRPVACFYVKGITQINQSQSREAVQTESRG